MTDEALIDEVPAKSDRTFESHMERIMGQTLDKFTSDKIPQWVEKHTKIDGRNYSFKGHEYQATIIGDTHREVAIRKCSQIGMSEATARRGLALVGVNPNYTVIMTQPTSGAAANFMKTRIDPVIAGSDFLKELVDKDLDNSEIKKFGESYFYLRGCQSNNAPISVPADHLIHDEVDFSDEEVITKYQSRLTHSPYKRKDYLSTPTFPKIGIDAHFQSSRRHFSMCKCIHCSQWFLPEYYDHVRIPGFTGDLREITKQNVGNYRWREAQLHCPHCGKVPDLNIQHREYVCENPESTFGMVGYQVSPFDAPNLHMRGDDPMSVASFLIDASTKYKRIADFVNFNLGKPMADAGSSVTDQDVINMIIADEVGLEGTYVYGLDMGLECHLVVGKIMPDGRLLIVEIKKIPLRQVKTVRKERAAYYWTRAGVADNLPYTETIMSMQDEDRDLFGAWYEDKKSLELYRVKSHEEDEDKGQEQLRQVYVNRNRTLDAIMDDIKMGNIKKVSCPLDKVWMEHLTDMKRVQIMDNDGQMKHLWKKTADGEDHFHHALLYCYIAAKMVGVSPSVVHNVKIVRTMRIRRR